MKIIDYFKKPKIFAIVGDTNTGKSNLIYYLIKELKENYSFNLVTFGLKFEIKGTKTINSLEELESIRNSLIFLDEFYTLFDLDDRKKKRQIEKTLRLINHNNNILVLVGVPENFKKFISSKVSTCFYKRVRVKDFINGSSLKNTLTNYAGASMGDEMLILEKNEVMVFNEDYKIFNVPYLAEYDSKKGNEDIFVVKNVVKNVVKSVPKNVQKKCAENVPKKMCEKKVEN